MKNNPEKKLKELVCAAKFRYGDLSDDELAKLGYKITRTPKGPMTKEEEEYWERMGQSNIIKHTPHERFIIVMSKLAQLTKDSPAGKWVPDEYNRQVLSDLLKYFEGDETGKYNPRKGIFLYGPVGAGKTTILRAFLSLPWQDTHVDDWLNNRTKVISCLDVIANLERQGSGEDVEERYLTGAYLFDDIGSEPPFKYAKPGAKPRMGSLLERRYMRGKGITHFTSNLTPKLISDVYGKRVGDRIDEMCNFVLLKGDSKRKLKPQVGDKK